MTPLNAPLAVPLLSSPSHSSDTNDDMTADMGAEGQRYSQSLGPVCVNHVATSDTGHGQGRDQLPVGHVIPRTVSAAQDVDRAEFAIKYIPRTSPTVESRQRAVQNQMLPLIDPAVLNDPIGQRLESRAEQGGLRTYGPVRTQLLSHAATPHTHMAAAGRGPGQPSASVTQEREMMPTASLRCAGDQSLKTDLPFSRSHKRSMSMPAVCSNLNQASPLNGGSPGSFLQAQNQSMAPPPTKRARVHAPTQASETGNFSRSGGPTQNNLINTEVPRTMAAPPLKLLLELRNSKPQPILIVPGHSTPIPAPLPYPPAIGGRGNRAMSQPGASHGTKNRIAIAISGAMCSGKFTLALLLAAVFEGETHGSGKHVAMDAVKEKEGILGENAIAKVIITHQDEYFKPVHQMPKVFWREPHPFCPRWEQAESVDATKFALLESVDGGEHDFEHYRKQVVGDMYTEAAYNANFGIDPKLLFNEQASHYPTQQDGLPIMIPKETYCVDCREAYDWEALGIAINDGLKGGDGHPGTLQTEQGRTSARMVLEQLVLPNRLEKLRERIREWVKSETALNAKFGFHGRAVRNGALKELFILEGPFIFCLSKENSKGGEALMNTCDVKLFLPATLRQAGKRRFSQPEFLDPPLGIKHQDHIYREKGYFSVVAWKEYEKEHAWLFQNGKVENEQIAISKECHMNQIYMRDWYDKPAWADRTLDWAVECILTQLSLEESFGRQCFWMENHAQQATRGLGQSNNVQE